MKRALLSLALVASLSVPAVALADDAEGNAAKNASDGTLVIRVDGNFCHTCALGNAPVLMKISRTLKKVGAVQNTSIDRNRSAVRVAYDPERISPEQIGDALVDHGLRVTEHITVTGEAVTVTMR